MRIYEGSLEARPAFRLPKAGIRLLRFILPEADGDPVLGDLAEMLEDSTRPRRSPRGTKLWCWWQILYSAGVFSRIRLARWLGQPNPDIRSLGGLGRAVAEYYVAVVLFYLFLQSALVLSAITAIRDLFCGIRVSNGLLFFSSKCVEAVAQSNSAFLRSWEDPVAAAIVVLMGLFILRYSQGLSARLAAYVTIVASAYRLIPFVMSLLASGDSWWFNYGWKPPSASTFRILLIILALGLVVLSLWHAFRRLFSCERRGSSVTRLGLFLHQFLIPTVFVSFLLQTAFVRRWNIWLLEYRVVTLLPVISVGIFVMLFTRRPVVQDVAD